MTYSISSEILYYIKGSDSTSHIVILKTKGTRTSIDARLKEPDFEKSGNGYEKMKNAFSKFKT